MNKYVAEFKKLKCHEEIMEVVYPVSRLPKEVSESMAILKQLRKLTLKYPNENYVIFDLCAGNALTSVMASFLFKNVYCHAFDIAKRNRPWYKVSRFIYHQKFDIFDSLTSMRLQKLTWEAQAIPVLIGVHACGKTSEHIIKLYNILRVCGTKDPKLILMPCCVGEMKGYSLPDVIVQKIGTYMKWCLYLYDQVESKKRMVIDNFCLSPKNTVIVGGF